MKSNAEFIELIQDLLDAGNSRNGIAGMLGVHHSKVDRAFNKGLVEDYTAFDEDVDKISLSQNFEWLWEEDKLEECCNLAFDNYSVDLMSDLGDNYAAVGVYVKREYGNLYEYLKVKNKVILWEFFHKTCSTCTIVKTLNRYSKKKDGFFGISSQCNDCVVARVVFRYRTNEDYRNSVKRSQREWNKRNKEKVREASVRGVHKRLARKRMLPDDLTKEQLEITISVFEGGCAITGEEDIHLDHVIPLSIGHGGTTFGNISPLRSDLNMSKSNRNIFEWFDSVRQRFELSQENFDTLIEWLASTNDMTVEEYRDHVYWCHENPRTIDEIKTEGGTAS